MMRLGFNMEGTEDRFEHWLMVSSLAHGDPGDEPLLLYLEIGVADCRTLFSVAQWADNNTCDWRCLGTDVKGSPYFNPTGFFKDCPFPCSVHDGVPFDPDNGDSKCLIVLLGEAFPDDETGTVSFCLIDGCHGKACVERDFSNMEGRMLSGGIVAFHDACLEDQGGPANQHCGTGVAVREALLELDLLPDSTRFRKGWNFLEEVHGDKTRNGNGFVFVQKL